MDLRNWYSPAQPHEENSQDLLQLRKQALERKKLFLAGTLPAKNEETPKRISQKIRVKLEFTGKNEITLGTEQILTEELEEGFRSVGGEPCETLFKWIFPASSYMPLRSALVSKEEVELSDLPRFLSQILIEFHKPKANQSPELASLPGSLLSSMYEFQKEGVQFIINKGGRGLIGDEMGVGKTLQAIASAFLYSHEWPLLVICPASLKVNWRNELLKWLPGISRKEIYLLDSKIHPSPFAKVWITSYNLVAKSEAILKSQVFEVIIADECHYVKNYSAKRSKVIIPMLQKAKRAIMISGTPVISRPAEIYNILTSLRPDVFRSFKEFANRYCDPKEKFGHVDYSGSSNVKELYNLLSSTIMIRRLKSDVLTQLPPKIRQKVEIQVEVTHCKTIRKKYNKIKNNEKNSKGDENKKSNSVQQNSSDINQFVIESYSLTAKAKIKGVIDYISYLLENDCKFLVFAHHQEMMQAIQDEVVKANVHFIRIDGKTPVDTRGDAVHEFQSNALCKVAILSITAAGIGLTLTAANLVIIAEMAWSPSTMIQAEDRVHRIGQKKSVNIHYLFGPGTLDEYIWPKIHEKLSVISSTLDNDVNPETESLMNPFTRIGIGDIDEIFEDIEIFSNN